MTREEMLEILHKTDFSYIDPPSEWKDIGFTERPIWVNASGYGYVMCDEHIECGECGEIPEEKWISILGKINEGTLRISDIEETSLFDILNEWIFDSLLDLRDSEDEFEAISSFFSDLKNLSKEAPKHIWWLEDPLDGSPLMFFCTKESFKKAYERDECDYSWDDLEDDMLEEWIKRLSNAN